MDTVRVKVMTTPRLLADLLIAALDAPPLQAWNPGDSPAEVTIINSANVITDSPLTIVLGDCLDDPISVILDGQRCEVAPLHLEGLHSLVLELARSARGDESATHLGSTELSGT